MVSLLFQMVFMSTAPWAAGAYFGTGKKVGPDALLIGVDQDEEAIQAAGKRLENIGCRHCSIHENFSNIGKILDENRLIP